ncbi:MAG TPA: isoamylase early set domain-containing protein [Gemmatimonadales bacterium]
MSEHDEDVIERVVSELRRPVQIDPAVDTRVMEEIARLPVRRGHGGLRAARVAWRWLARPRAIQLSPLAGLGIAAGLAALVLALSGRWPGPTSAPPAERATREFRFIVVEPHAARVSLVGDFNDWDAARTPMRRMQGGPVWSAVVPLRPGRYRYAFLVDGRRWLADPTAPAARDDEFGTPSSVVTVGSS